MQSLRRRLVLPLLAPLLALPAFAQVAFVPVAFVPVASVPVASVQIADEPLLDEATRAALGEALARAGDRADGWRAVLEDARRDDAARAADLAFLVAYMPTHDLVALDPDWVAADAALAREAWTRAPWHDQVPRAVYRDAILPYANVDEPREDWRPGLRERFAELVAECETPGEAAQVLNREVFGALGVKYSTKRRRANQAPSESIEQGLASCTGLSILLADACRAVGVPARLAGIGAWPHKNGNHTWVEVWDGEAWRFTGAAEYDANGLDRAWFAGDARNAVAGDPLHAVMAVQWRAAGGARFHLPWAPDAAFVNAVDVSARYAPQEEREPAAGPPDEIALRVRVWDGDERVEAAVVVTRLDLAGKRATLSGRSKGPRADLNDMLEFSVPIYSEWRVEARAGEREVEHALRPLFGTTTLDLQLAGEGTREQREMPKDVHDGVLAFFAVLRDGESIDAGAYDRFVAASPDVLRHIAWRLYQVGDGLHDDLAADHANSLVRTADRESPYTLKKVGERREGERWPLVIAMHGGGGAPQEVNDQQWRHMQIYYKDHPEAGGYLYLALRAPNNEWNGVYDDAIVPLIERLIRQMVTQENADPTRVYTLGYSHGGYGAWVIGPKAPDLFAGVHSSAAAATDGETRHENLANLPFSFMYGELDTAYGRFERSERSARLLAELREASGGTLYPFEAWMIEGNGHGGLPDRDLLPQLLERRRTAVPTRLVWHTTDDRIAHHWWLHLPEPKSGAVLEASLTRAAGDAPNRIELSVEGVERVELLLDERHVDPTRPLEVLVNGGEPRVFELAPSATTLLETLWRRGDPTHAATLRIALEVPAGD